MLARIFMLNSADSRAMNSTDRRLLPMLKCLNYEYIELGNDPQKSKFLTRIKYKYVQRLAYLPARDVYKKMAQNAIQK